MKNKYTKGPWHVDNQVDERGVSHISVRAEPMDHPTIGPQICSINTSTNYKSFKMNARLVAAAPELLDAVEGFIKLLESSDLKFSCYGSEVVKAQALVRGIYEEQ